jgi:carboxyl-terminal processing protease
MKRGAHPLLGVVVIAAASIAGGYFTRSPHSTAIESGVQQELEREFQEALNVIEENYAGVPNLEMLGKHSIQGMLRQLDPHSSFFTKSEFDELQTEQRSRFYGIGVIIKKIYNRVFIVSATPGTPAYRAGLRYGDAIIAVDGISAEDWSTEQVMQRVRGEKGEPVEITVERAGWPRPLTFRIVRDEVKLPTVRNAFIIGQTSTGYIGLTGGFSSKTDEELTAALIRLKQESMRQLILDLRNNPGGLLDQAIKVAAEFLPAGLKILEVRDRNSNIPARTFEVPAGNVPENMPMVILINRYTASASEVVAGALQDHDRALIVGENSFGKGLVQSVFRLWGGAGLTLTTAKWYTPIGRLIQRDYSNASFYNYYLKRNEDGRNNAAHGNALHTDLGRTVYAGGGITPDLEVKSPETGRLRARLMNGVFYFVRQLVAGQISGLREYKINETQYKAKLTQEDIDRYPVTDKVIAAFRQFISDKPQFNVSDEKFNANLDFIRSRIRIEVITAAFGAEAGDQVALYDDPQFRVALEKVEEARQLAENARRLRGDRQ